MTRSLKCITPVDGSVYVERPLASLDETVAALSRARAAQQEWRHVSVGDRQSLLNRAVDAFIA
ncbi:MAG TPA: aldehyde dehydrogenase family protein, partial [Gammaproteobacteria bacterium]|nr:aldehyde dehydrogenase family protein [Gammaproteobacteria bacterium]